MTTFFARRRALSVAVLVSLLAAGARGQVDPDWLRMWREAQTHRPASLAPEGRLAPPGEPGTLLVVEGRVFEPDGETPAARTVVFAYQTDREGIYFGPNRPGRPWRLQGWVRTDEDGRFRFHTIRPGPYPDRSEPAHIHLTLESPSHGRQWTPSLLFADDPLVSSEQRTRSAARGRFGNVCEVRMEKDVAHVRVSLRLKTAPDF